MKGQQNRKAAFKTVITLILNGEHYQFSGIANGKIRDSECGNKGFGYDPIFEPEGFNVTFAEMTMEEKNAISHRGKAVKLLSAFLLSR